MHVRIGLSAGEPVEENNDLFGSTVQMAARVCNSASPDQILAVQSVKDNCTHKQQEFLHVGHKVFKGFNEPANLYEIPWR
jgi:class 3 adenylate cyclase